MKATTTGRQTGKSLTDFGDAMRYMQEALNEKNTDEVDKEAILRKYIQHMGQDEDKLMIRKEVKKRAEEAAAGTLRDGWRDVRETEVVEVDEMEEAIATATAIMKRGE